MNGIKMTVLLGLLSAILIVGGRAIAGRDLFREKVAEEDQQP